MTSFATFDRSEFPKVKVTFSENIIDRNDFEKFLSEWLELYDNCKYFEFVFDTINVGLINPKYSIMMSLFIKELKKRDIQYLTKSEIYVYNKFTKYLLDLIFNLQKPVAPVHIHYDDEIIIINP
tara:strand:- start:1217 stop:1588 length:372 start_codon:yes stop_codon:yes gene_type:complete